ncbi:MAG: hypothetical protein ACKOPM_14965 [Novosphingobium sp.]
MKRLVAVLLALAIGAPAHAETGPFSNGMQYWPSISVSSSAPVPGGVWTKRRQTILTMRRHYTGLFQLDSAFQSKMSGASVPAGVKLYQFGRSAAIVCADTEIVLNKKGLPDDIFRHCFLDSNGDRVFDKYFIPKNSSTTSVFDYIVIPNAKKMESIEGVKISKIAIGPKDALPDLHLSWQHRSILTGVQILVCEGEYVDDKADLMGIGNCISPQYQIDRSRLPFPFELFGARFVIKERRGDELLFVQLDPIVSFDLYSRMR